MPKIIPEIPKKFEEKFPKAYQNKIQHWGFFTQEELDANKGKLLMLDIDFRRYCSLSCSSCFRKSSRVDEGNPEDLSYDELLAVIDEAKGLGLQSIKICGAGEPMQDSRFLPFARDIDKKGIGLAVFTKGQVVGNDEEARRFNGVY